ncbi:sensor histidine kinase [Sunxiuqinia indica]|uniref:sensor histidine kinase n=1 Tax=Sunxiuqinia indica TaxID=2692584 RepID=UPI001358E63F|nr:histidine kinase [Sunxiuqinia indica]
MIKKMLSVLGRLIQSRPIQHLAFWCLSFLVLVNILRVSAEIHHIDLIYALVFHLPILLVVYLNEAILFPRLLAKNKYGWYLLSIVILLAFGAEFYLQLFERWIDYLFPGYYFIAYYTFWDILLFFAVYLVLTTLIKLARAWFRINQVEQEKTTSELRALRSQLNPHFLFNSLNNLYSLTRKKSDLAPQLVLKLSDILRYVIYDAETNFISLEKELHFLKKYIEVQRIRLEPDFNLEVDQKGDPSGFKIAPLLLLPFVENAFKYGTDNLNTGGRISIAWENSDNDFQFFVANEKAVENDSSKDEYKGMGIQNVRKRLDLLYPDKHELVIDDQQKRYLVKLKLSIK